MKYNLLYCLLFSIFFSCKTKEKPVVNAVFIDSLFTEFSMKDAVEGNEKELLFWKKKIAENPPGVVSELKYAAALTNRFLLKSGIEDLTASDSVLREINKNYAQKEPYAFFALVHNAILQHRFVQADSFLFAARNNGIKPYESFAAGFDVDFELGRYDFAYSNLQKIGDPNDYGYQFRKAKWMHYKGEVDSAIKCMERAAFLAGTNHALQQAALSNAGDLCLHNKEVSKAYNFYKQSLQLGNPDVHSLTGIGNIALLHDKNVLLAEKIYSFIQTYSNSPDILLKQMHIAEQKNDTVLQVKYAMQFRDIVTEKQYGNMYNKYLLILYTSVLDDQQKATDIVTKELLIRNTPQTQAWKVWSLFYSGKKDEAYKLFKEKVSGKPLEAIELYWMGKMMKGLGKGYNAKELFKIAYKNKFDFSPALLHDIELSLAD